MSDERKYRDALANIRGMIRDCPDSVQFITKSDSLLAMVLAEADKALASSPQQRIDT